jgi:hypothetical protein
MRWEGIRMYRDGQQPSDNDLRTAVGIVGDVRAQAITRGARIALIPECANLYPRLIEPRLAGVATGALGIEGFEEIARRKGGDLPPPVLAMPRH